MPAGRCMPAGSRAGEAGEQAASSRSAAGLLPRMPSSRASEPVSPPKPCCLLPSPCRHLCRRLPWPVKLRQHLRRPRGAPLPHGSRHTNPTQALRLSALPFIHTCPFYRRRPTDARRLAGLHAPPCPVPAQPAHLCCKARPPAALSAGWPACCPSSGTAMPKPPHPVLFDTGLPLPGLPCRQYLPCTALLCRVPGPCSTLTRPLLWFFPRRCPCLSPLALHSPTPCPQAA